MPDQEVDLYAEAVALTREQHDAAVVRAWITLYGGSDEAVAYQQQVVEDEELDLFLAELDLEDAEETDDPEQIAHFQQVLDRRTWELTEAQRWRERLRPFLACSTRPRRATPASTRLTRSRGSTRQRRSRRAVRPSARSGDSDSGLDEPPPGKRRRLSLGGVLA